MRNEVMKSIKYNQLLTIVYQSEQGIITKRRIKAFKMDDNYINAFCFLRHSKRSFKFDNILALEPVQLRKDMVM